MKSLAWIGVLEEMRAVEIGEAVLVRGEMRRHPVEDYADIRLMQLVDQILEVLRRAVAARRREVAGALIAPGPQKGRPLNWRSPRWREINLFLFCTSGPARVR